MTTIDVALPVTMAIGCEVPERVVERLARDVGRDDVAAGATEQQRISVRRRFRHVCGADHRAGAGTVLDHDRSKPRLDAVGPQASDHVVHAGRRRRSDEPDRPVRVIRSGPKRRSPSKLVSPKQARPSQAQRRANQTAAHILMCAQSSFLPIDKASHHRRDGGTLSLFSTVGPTVDRGNDFDNLDKSNAISSLLKLQQALDPAHGDVAAAQILDILGHRVRSWPS